MENNTGTKWETWQKIETFLKKQIEIQEINNTITALKASLESFNETWSNRGKNQQAWRQNIWNYTIRGAKRKNNNN